MLNAVTSLEGVLPVLDQRHILQALLSPQPLGNGSLAPVLILRPLLCPQPQLDSFLRNRMAGLVLQVLCTLCALGLPITRFLNVFAGCLKICGTNNGTTSTT